MSDCKNHPPVFDGKDKPYERYVKEIRARCIVSELEKKKQGVAIDLALPKNYSSGVWDKVSMNWIH